MDGRSIIAWNLRRLRFELSVPQERLAADSGVDRAYVSQLERKRGNATIDLLDRLAAALEVPLAEFFREPEAGAKKPGTLPVGRKPRPKRRRSI